MPKSRFCKVEIRGEWKKITINDAIARNERRGRCIKCDKLVRPHRRGKNGTPAAHFEHLSRNPSCSLSDHR